MIRKNNRPYGDIRTVSIKQNPFGNADSSLLFEQGNTKIYVTISLQQGVPKFLKNSGVGWLSAEYVMHPYAGDSTRSAREIFPNGRDHRSVEISRMIGRSFRTVLDLNSLGERTIFVDCDVLQADGGTRTACINALSVALKNAETLWLSQKKIRKHFIKERLFAVSVGVLDYTVLVDLDKDEDNLCQADFNFIMTEHGNVVEVQGTAEKVSLPWTLFDECRVAASNSIKDLSSRLIF